MDKDGGNEVKRISNERKVLYGYNLVKKALKVGKAKNIVIVGRTPSPFARDSFIIKINRFFEC